MADYYIAWVCQCCMIAAVNGEPCTCFADTEIEDLAADMHEQHPAGLMGKIEEHATPGLLDEHHTCGRTWDQRMSEDSCGCEENSFTWSSCDGCESTCGGERYAFTCWLD